MLLVMLCNRLLHVSISSSSFSASHSSYLQKPQRELFWRSCFLIAGYVGRDSEKDPAKRERDFKYGCVGYSVYLNENARSSNLKEAPAKLPACAGFEVLLQKLVTGANQAPPHVHNREDGHQSLKTRTRKSPETRTRKPAHSTGDEFLTRFTRNASVVALGTARNMRKVGKYVKENVGNALYPDRRRPK